MKIKEEVANVLGNSNVIGGKLYLPQGQLERSLYLAVDKVLKALGGKWNRKEKAHLFNKSVEDIIEEVLLTGEYIDQKKEYQFFETPTEVAKYLVELANIQEGEIVLEPSAGKARIASLIKNCECIELNEENYTYLKSSLFNVVGRDFLKTTKEYDVIIANPPFSKQQDIDHIRHMIKLSKRKVVSIASASVMFRTNKKTVEFREYIETLKGTIMKLPANTFEESGTRVNSCIVNVDIT